MSPKSYLSGGIGIPEGGGKLLSRPDEAAVENLIRQEINITNIVQDEPDGGGGSTETEYWIRFNAAGTKLAGENITVSRESEGKYLLTASAAFATSGGFHQYGVLALPSAASGNGGDGISPFKEFSGAQVQGTDDATNDFFYYETGNEIIVLGTNDDDLYRHDLDNFGAPTQVDATAQIRQVVNSGCINREGTYIWLSGDSGYGIRAVRLSDNTITNFGNGDKIAVAATESYVVFYEGGVHKRYNFNLGLAALGAAVATWATSVQRVGSWDAAGRLWFVASTELVSYDPTIDTVVRTYDYPTLSGTAGPISAVIFDEFRNCLYVPISEVSATHGWIFKASGWSLTQDNIIQWEAVLDLGGNTPIGVWHDTSTDILFISSYVQKYVLRVFIPTWTVIDTVLVNDTTPDNTQVDYELDQVRWAYYKGTKGYVIATKSSAWYLVEISYEGDPIDGFGGGAGAVTSVLIALYEIISATQAYVYTFRSIQPPIFADAEVTAEFVS